MVNFTNTKLSQITRNINQGIRSHRHRPIIPMERSCTAAQAPSTPSKRRKPRPFSNLDPLMQEQIFEEKTRTMSTNQTPEPQIPRSVTSDSTEHNQNHVKFMITRSQITRIVRKPTQKKKINKTSDVQFVSERDFKRHPSWWSPPCMCTCVNMEKVTVTLRRTCSYRRCRRMSRGGVRDVKRRVRDFHLLLRRELRGTEEPKAKSGRAERMGLARKQKI